MIARKPSSSTSRRARRAAAVTPSDGLIPPAAMKRPSDAAVQEDVAVVAVSIMTSGHLQIAGELVPKLRDAGLDQVLVIFGGTIPDVDFESLHELGVHRTFPPGLPGSAVAEYIRANAGHVTLGV